VVDGAVITFVDISEQKQGDQLRRLGTILRDSNNAITVQDFHGKILAWNRGAAQMYGWTEEEALAMNALEMMIPQNKQDETAALYQRLAKGESTRSFESERVTRDGKALTVWLTLTVLVDDAKRPVAIASTERAVSEQKLDEQNFFFENRALKALNQWYQTLLDNAEMPAQSLAEMACRVLVEEAGYRGAWIGRVGKDKAGIITLFAWVGPPEESAWALSETGRDGVDQALSRGKPVTVRHPSTHPPADPGALPYETYLVLPILDEQDPLGVLVIYAAEPDAFVEAEVASLAAFSRRIARGLGPDGQNHERPAK
jgi:PAS domain S-box-containing protein